MKFCRTCGAPMEDEATFCPMCGTKDDENSDKYISNETTVLDINDAPFNENLYQYDYDKQSQNKKLGKGAVIAIIFGVIIVLVASVFGLYKLETRTRYGSIGNNLGYAMYYDGITDVHLSIYPYDRDEENSWETFQKYPWEKVAGKIQWIFIDEGVEYIPISAFFDCDNENLAITIENPNCDIECENDLIGHLVPTLGLSPGNTIKVHGYSGSTAEEYVKALNQVYLNAYEFISLNDFYSYAEDSQSNEFEFGTVDGDTFSNNYVNLHITLPSDEWRFLADEEIGEYTSGILDAETGKYCLNLESSSDVIYYDKVIKNDITGTNIMMEFLKFDDWKVYQNYYEEDFLKYMFEGIESSYLENGMVVTESDYESGYITIGNNNYLYGNVKVQALLVKINQIISVSKFDDGFYFIAISGQDDTEELMKLLEMFN